MLAIELLDEAVFGVRQAAWPAIQSDFHLTYAAIGLLLTLPSLVGALLQPALGLLADTGRRRIIVALGGVAFAASLLITASAWAFLPLLAGFLLLDTASGAFVALSQAALVDLEPDRSARSMARWVLAGSLGVLAGPLLLAGALTLGLDWRPLFAALALLTLPLVLLARGTPEGAAGDDGLRGVFKAAMGALRQLRVLRWLLILQLTDLMGDVFAGFLALYLVNVAAVSPLVAAAGLTLWSGAALLGDALLLPLQTRVSGMTYLRVTAALVLATFPLLLLAPSLPVKLVCIALLGLLHAGWYAIPQGRLFDELPGASGTAVAIGDLASFVGHLAPLAIGLAAERAGLGSALWLLLLAPLSLLLCLPRDQGDAAPTTPEESL